jgi:hypothetical protein
MRHLILSLLIIVPGIATASGCAFTEVEEERMQSTDAPASGSEQSLVNEALQFSGVVLPPGAEVLGVTEESGLDQLYALAIAVDQDSAEALLAGSGFHAQMRPGQRVFLPPVPGFEPNASGNISSGQDKFQPDGDRPVVNRKILVDRTDPARPTMHIWAFTT